MYISYFFHNYAIIIMNTYKNKKNLLCIHEGKKDKQIEQDYF